MLHKTKILRVSVIIISYNVSLFLEQCLLSVQSAIAFASERLPFSNNGFELIVVDNQSSDGSVAYLQPIFPQVQFIANAVNLGFSKANNQALSMSNGEWILFLNPDTLLPEDFFVNCLDFVARHPDAGAVGCRMLDGSGKYLPESKRGYPAVWASFCKMTGLTALFPHSRIMAAYYAGHLPAEDVNKVEVLSGACMFCKREALKSCGGFDERYFMYAEDIDLSYRIAASGYSLYYNPAVSIIHFKGESTVKDSRYIKQFYGAMLQFIEQHHTGRFSFVSRAFLKGAIWFRSRLALLQNLFSIQPENTAQLPAPYLLKGSPLSAKQLAEMLRKETALNENEAASVIYCTGPDYTMAQLLRDWEKEKRPAMVHLDGSKSVVGSPNNRLNGLSFRITDWISEMASNATNAVKDQDRSANLRSGH